MTKEEQMSWPEKFDIIIANPPYSKKLDLKFLDKAFDLAKEEVVFVHPSTAYVEQKGKYKPYINFRNKIEGNLKSLEFFNGNGIFGIYLFIPCSIAHISVNKKHNSFILNNRIGGRIQECNSEDIHNLSILGNNNRFNKLKSKVQQILEYNKSIQDIGFVLSTSQQKTGKYLRDNNSFFVESSHIRGHIHSEGDLDSPLLKDDFYTILTISPEIKSKVSPSLNIWWEFKTINECENFIKFSKTNFARFCLSLSKINQNLARGELKNIPAVDFTQEWTDEKLYKHFNITEKEQDFIKEIIPPYYD